MLSIPHMVVLFIVVLVVFGPNKLPELARGFGKLMAEFRKASTDFKSAFEQEMRDIERQNMQAERKKAAEAAAAAAAATPPGPATLATAAGTETQAVEAPAANATDASSTSNGATGDTRATEALVATPASETVARGMEQNGTELSSAASNNGASHDVAADNTIHKPNRSAGAQQATNDSVAANDPAHDTQQPA